MMVGEEAFLRCGISTACFFPGDTVTSFRCLAEAGVPVAELFLNTFSELEQPTVNELLAIQKANGLAVSSFHPFTGAMEGFFFASRYAGRFPDGLALYRRYFVLCEALGTDKCVFHGDHDFNAGNFAMEEYADRFCALAEEAARFGVTLCHENVAYCRIKTPQIAQQAKSLMGERAAFVLDTKQARRAGATPEEMADAMGSAIRQVHISDRNSQSNCLPPGKGDWNPEGFINKLKAQNFNGDLIIEVYSDSFTTMDELLRSVQYLEQFL